MEKFSEVLATMAEKMGVTVELLWGVLVQQALVDGIVTLIQYVVVVVWVVMFCKITPRVAKDIKNYDKEDAWWWLIGVASVITVILSLAVFFSLPNTVASFVNPEYWALEYILNKVPTTK
jgi:uncharacterized protein YqhQ